jgi:hypothetical protein
MSGAPTFLCGLLLGAFLLVLYYRHHHASSFNDLPGHCYLCGRPAKFVVVTSDIARRKSVAEQTQCGPCHEYIVQHRVDPPWKKEGGCPPWWHPEPSQEQPTEDEASIWRESESSVAPDVLEAAVDALAGESLYDRTLLSDIRKARARQPEHLRHRFCRICGPFMMDSCPAAPAHDLRPEEPLK